MRVELLHKRVAIVGTGIGGLIAALLLASRGLEVIVFERAEGPGGKMRPASIGGRLFDCGPTVLTMRWVFDEILADAGTSLDECLTLKPASILARHAWSENERLDLFASIERSSDAIGDLAGSAEASSYRRFCVLAQRVYRALEPSYIRALRPNVGSLVADAGVWGLADLARIGPFQTLWEALAKTFRDARLRQLFARYATYCGSSPFLAPSTLMLVAHVERAGVWLVDGGMHRLAAVLADLAERRGAVFRYSSHVAALGIEGDRATSLTLADGERHAFDAIIVNADVAALASGLLGRPAASAVEPIAVASRSLSAITWAMLAAPAGFPLLRHNVFFSSDYRAEFEDVLTVGRLPRQPTVYLCAQDRDDSTGVATRSPERLLCLVNAPAHGDRRPLDIAEIEQCEQSMHRLLEHCGLRIDRDPQTTAVTTPRDFHQHYPGTGGALYGQATHGWRASFTRPGARSRVAGLYLAGGSTHPGPGVPMAALSGRMAAATLLSDLVSTSQSQSTAMRGGMSTR